MSTTPEKADFHKSTGTGLTEKIGPNLWLIRSQSLRLFFDLQFRSIVMALNDVIATWPGGGTLLDFGAGTSPYQSLFPLTWKIESLDPLFSAADYKDLAQIPSGKRFDRILMIEVLEHLATPEFELKRLLPLLTQNGELIVSVPFSARIHPCPKDFRRWTPEGLEQVFEQSGFNIVEIKYRGTDSSTIVAKTLYFFARRLGFNPSTLLGLLLSPILFLALLLHHGRPALLPEKAEDPLGFLIRARPQRSQL